MASLAGTLNIPGTGDGLDILSALAAAYTADNPGTIVVVPPSTGSPGAIIALHADEAVLGRIARPLSETESGYGITSKPIINIPSAFFVHPTAKIDNLTTPQVTAIFEGKITNWAEVGGPDLRIKVVRREDADSTVGVLRASMPGFKNLVFATKSKTAVTTQDAIETAQQVEGAIAFAPYSPVSGSTVTVLKIDGLFPTDDHYPCKGTVSLAFKPSTVTAEARSFMMFAADSPKAHQLMRNFGGVPIRKD